MGIRTSGNFGRRFEIPSACSTGLDTHEKPMRSFMKFIDKDPDAKIEELFSEQMAK